MEAMAPVLYVAAIKLLFDDVSKRQHIQRELHELSSREHRAMALSSVKLLRTAKQRRTHFSDPQHHGAFVAPLELIRSSFLRRVVLYIVKNAMSEEIVQETRMMA